MAEPAAADMIVADLDDQFRAQRLPLAGALGAPPAGASRRVAGKARRFNQRFELFGQRLAMEIMECRSESDMVEPAFAVV
ncbi:MAG: hypothetical protein WA709_20195 [Stellaceae bacterium]